MLDPAFKNILIDGGPRLFPELGLNASSGQRDKFQNAVYVKIGVVVGINEGHDLRDIRILDVVDAAGLPLHDFHRGDHDIERLPCTVHDLSVQQCAGLVATTLHVEFHRGDRWVGDAAEQLVVVNSEDCDIFGTLRPAMLHVSVM